MNHIQQLLALNMKECRKRLGISQANLAEQCGLTPSYIGEIEIGRKFPSAKSLEKIANVLKLKPYQLFFDKLDWGDYDKNELLQDFTMKLKEQLNKDIDEVAAQYQ